MGKKNKWIGVVKRVFSPECGEKRRGKQDEKVEKSPKTKKKWGFGKSKPADPFPDQTAEACKPPPIVPALVPPEEVKLTQAEHDQAKQVYSAAIATAQAAAAAAHAAAEAARLTAALARFSGKSKEEVAAIKIQTAFRGYLARRALRALRGLVRLKKLMNGDSVKRQSASTLHCMQTLTRIHSEIRSRRIKMNEENQALQRQLQLKRERELEALKAAMGEDWDDSLQSKEQIEAGITNKHEAAIRRERALAYAFSHQWKSSSRSINPTFTDPNNPQWGWSWLERWTAARPWENRATNEKEASNDHASTKSTAPSAGGEIIRSYICRDLGPDRSASKFAKSGKTAVWHSPSTPKSKPSSLAGKMKSASPRGGWAPSEDDSRSLRSIQSERPRRHSLASSSVRDDESLTSSPAIPNYMTPTESAKAKSRFHSPSAEKIMTPDRTSTGSVKKRLSFPAMDKPTVSPVVPRRHSGPPKLDAGSIKSISIPEQSNPNDGKR